MLPLDCAYCQEDAWPYTASTLDLHQSTFVQHMLHTPNALLAGDCGMAGVQMDLRAMDG